MDIQNEVPNINPRGSLTALNPTMGRAMSTPSGLLKEARGNVGTASSMIQELEQFNRLVEELDHVSKSLIERISPVLSPGSDQTEDALPDGHPVPLVGAVLSLRAKVRRVNLRLLDALQRVEV